MACTDLTDKANFLILYPGFSDPTYDAIIDLKLECLSCAFCAEAWGCDLQEGSAHYLGHLLTMYLKTLGTGVGGSAGSGDLGPVTAQAQGPVSRSYGTAASDDSGSFGETVAGRQYLSMLSNLPVTGIAPGMGLGECYV